MRPKKRWPELRRDTDRGMWHSFLFLWTDNRYADFTGVVIVGEIAKVRRQKTPFATHCVAVRTLTLAKEEFLALVGVSSISLRLGLYLQETQIGEDGTDFEVA